MVEEGLNFEDLAENFTIKFQLELVQEYVDNSFGNQIDALLLKKCQYLDSKVQILKNGDLLAFDVL